MLKYFKHCVYKQRSINQSSKSLLKRQLNDQGPDQEQQTAGKSGESVRAQTCCLPAKPTCRCRHSHCHGPCTWTNVSHFSDTCSQPNMIGVVLFEKLFLPFLYAQKKENKFIPPPDEPSRCIDDIYGSTNGLTLPEKTFNI